MNGTVRRAISGHASPSSLKHLRPHFLALFGSSGLTQITNFALLPVITTLYEPDAVGIAQSFLAVSLLLTVVSSGKIEQLILTSDAKVLPEIVAASTYIAAAATVTTTAVIAAIALTQSENLSTIYWALVPSISIAALNQVAQMAAVRKNSFRHIARVRLEQSVVNAAVVSALGSIGAGPWGIVLGQLVQQSIGTLRLFKTAAPELAIKVVWASRAAALRTLRSNRTILLAASAAGLVNTAAWSVPVLFIAYAYGTVEAGLFALAFKMLSPVRTVLTATFDQITLGEGARLLESANEQSIRAQVFGIMRYAVGAGLVVLVGGITATFVLASLLPDAWQGATSYTVPLATVVALQVGINPLSCIPILLKQQHLQLPYDISRVVVVTATFLLTYHAGGSAHHAVVAYAVGMSLMYAVYAKFFVALIPK